jgi:hypothetical protein
LQIVDHKASETPCSKIEYNKVYNGGNAAQLSRDLGWDADPAGVLYCGDEPVGDVMAPKNHCKWATAAIVEELEALDESLHFGDELDSACYHHTEQWGQFFYSDDQKQRLSYWGHLLDRSSTVYLPCVSRFARFPISHVYLAHRAASFEDTQSTKQDASKLFSALAVPKDRSDPEVPLLVVDHAAVAEASEVLAALEDKKKKAQLKHLNIHRS